MLRMSSSWSGNRYHRNLRIEQLEDRHMLATMADIVFLYDESGSGQNEPTEQWLIDTVSTLETHFDPLGTGNDIDARYGLVGFGDPDGFASSQVVNTSVPTDLFGDTTQLIAAIPSLDQQGKFEDGWDAIEHTIAEYDCREGAVPVLVLIQNQEGRNWVNTTLTHPRLLASLKSKNILLNTMTVGTGGSTLAAVFELTTYEVQSGDFSNLRVLGVEADQADDIADGLHDIHAFNTSGTLVANPPASESDALQISHKGSNTGATGMVGTGKSVLISQQLTGGLGASAAGYRAKSFPFWHDRGDLRRWRPQWRRHHRRGRCRPGLRPVRTGAKSGRLALIGQMVKETPSRPYSRSSMSIQRAMASRSGGASGPSPARNSHRAAG